RPATGRQDAPARGPSDFVHFRDNFALLARTLKSGDSMGQFTIHRSRRLLAGAALGVLMAATPALAQETVRIGPHITGELSARDHRLDTGEHLDTYLFQGRAGERLSVRMSSSEIDPYLMIRGPG